LLTGSFLIALIISLVSILSASSYCKDKSFSNRIAIESNHRIVSRNMSQRFDGMCCWRRVAVARVFALVVRCSDMMLFCLFSR